MALKYHLHKTHSSISFDRGTNTKLEHGGGGAEDPRRQYTMEGTRSEQVVSSTLQS